MNIEESIEYLKNCIDDEYDFKNATRKKDKEAYKIILTAYEKEKEITDKIDKLNIPVETLIAEFERLEDLEDDREMLKAELEKEKEKNKKCEYFEMVADELYKHSISKDKIKAKIEEVDYKMIAHQDVREAVKAVLQSLLEEKE